MKELEWWDRRVGVVSVPCVGMCTMMARIDRPYKTSSRVASPVTCAALPAAHAQLHTNVCFPSHDTTSRSPLQSLIGDRMPFATLKGLLSHTDPRQMQAAHEPCKLATQRTIRRPHALRQSIGPMQKCTGRRPASCGVLYCTCERACVCAGACVGGRARERLQGS